MNQIYDIDNKTYLFKLHRNEEKTVLLLESGNRIHSTAFEWSKSTSPSGFTMKLRKHLKNKRLENISQLGTDRIVILQFGTGEACYYVVLELYDRGNIVLCDFNYICLNVLRPHVEGEEVRFAVREIYPLSRARNDLTPPPMGAIKENLQKARPGDNLRTVLNPMLPFGAAVIDHWLIHYNLNDCKIGGAENNAKTEDDSQKSKKKKKNRDKIGTQASRDFSFENDFTTLINAINDMFTMMHKATQDVSSGFIVQKKELKPTEGGKDEFYYSNIEFHPHLFNQYVKEPVKEFPSFLQAVDEFFSNLESQKIDLKAIQLEREALKKLSNVRQDHASRLTELAKSQLHDRKKAELITRNQALVDGVVMSIKSLISKQISWQDIKDVIKEKQEQKDPVALIIRHLKFETNQITLKLSDPFANTDDDVDDYDQVEDDEERLETCDIDIDLGISAYSNATKYYDLKRYAAKKEQKTIEASGKALKSAEKKTQQTLKDVRVQTTITKARKVFWFEKFYWFISSENYLVIGGRDQQQNELIVKRYLRSNDAYVHAEIQGASSVVIKNPTDGEIPPKTLLEAGTMAISYSVAWDAKVATNAYWVNADQVSKTAPTGEYLSTGSFMIRGKKNFLPPCNLILGLSFLFKLEDSSLERHKGERRVRKFDDDVASIAATENEHLDAIVEEDIEIEVNDDKDDDEEDGIADEIGRLEVADEQSSDDEASSEFPDTHIKVEHTTGEVNIIKPDPKLERTLSEDAQQEELTLLQAAPLKVKKYEKKLKLNKKQQKQQPLPQQEASEKEEKGNQPKRGQKGKMKKIKEKYRDQDDEERTLRMEILKSSGSSKEIKKGDDIENAEEAKKPGQRKQKPEPKNNQEDFDEAPAADEVDMLDSLTGLPVDEDELLFAIPVIAPYQALQNYK